MPTRGPALLTPSPPPGGGAMHTAAETRLDPTFSSPRPRPMPKCMYIYISMRCTLAQDETGHGGAMGRPALTFEHAAKLLMVKVRP